jgi:hypothetical protein
LRPTEATNSYIQSIDQIKQEDATPTRSFELLDALIFEPAFTAAVRKVVVHALCLYSAILEAGPRLDCSLSLLLL